MPIYEYQCASCHKVHEVLQKFSDAPLAACPECDSPVEKLMSMSSFALKGTGWYTTDYKKKSASEVKPESEKAESKSEAKAESKSESKPESKAEPKSEKTKPESKTESKPESKTSAKTESKSKVQSASSPASH